MSANSWKGLVDQLRKVLGAFPDPRTGDNCTYSMEDIGSSAFSVFFTQSPSFLAHQNTMQKAKGQSNAQSLFEIKQIPCDNPWGQIIHPLKSADGIRC